MAAPDARSNSPRMGRVFARASFLPSLALNLVLRRCTTRQWYNSIDKTVILGALPFRSMTKQLVEKEGVRAVVSMNEDYELKYLCNSEKQWKKAGVSFLQLSTTDMFEAPSQEKLQRGVKFILDHKQKYEMQTPEMQGHRERLKQQMILLQKMNMEDSDLIGSDIDVTNSCRNVTSTTNVLEAKKENGGSVDDVTTKEDPGKVYVHCKAGRTRSATLVACYLMQVYGLTPKEALEHMTECRPHVWLGRAQHGAIERYYQDMIEKREQW